MRNTLFKELHKIAANDHSVYLIVGDVGFSLIEPFKDSLPQQFLNIGVCEQNMIGFAAGMTMLDYRVFVYSIIPFATMRCYEQIRNDICYQQLPVTIIGVGGGFAYGPQGSTHHAIDDINIMRGLPQMRVFCPGDPTEATQCLRKSLSSPQPTYIRLGRSNEPLIHSEKDSIDVMRPLTIIHSSENIIISSGHTLALAKAICETLRDSAIDIGLVSVPCLKPFDYSFLKEHSYRSIFSLEEHNIIGGLGSTLSEIIAEKLPYKPIFNRFGIPDSFVHFAGSSAHLREQLAFSPSHIVENIKNRITSN